MKRSIIYTALVLFLALFASVGAAQENFASNISTSISDDEKLLVAYDILATDGARSFSVVLFVTWQGTQVKTTTAYGDVGHNISPGREKAIVWYFKDDFDGNIANVKVEVFAYKENEPQALFEFKSIGNNGYAPCQVAFTNNSMYANEYLWNFGDAASGSTNLSFEKDPVHVFETGGVYTISLTARNSQTNMENVYFQSIQVKTHEPVTANFEIQGNNQLAPAKVSFNNTSVNADSYEWNFGDASSGKKNRSTKTDGAIKYKNPGAYSVRLVAKNHFSGLTDTLAKEVIVEAEKVAIAGFIHTKSSETAPSTVTFKNTSELADRYEWNFGDAGSGEKNKATEENPVHLFSKPGSYKVQLSAWSQGMKKPDIYTEVITIADLPQPPEAHFTIPKNNVIGPATINFSNQSLNATQYLWDFGDPGSGDDNTSDRKNPTHTYNQPGRYQVVLKASSLGFSRESTAADWVVITSPDGTLPAVKAHFIIENNHAAAPAVINFSDNSSNADSYLWNFGNEKSGDNQSEIKNPVHIYTESGTYQVTLTAKNIATGETDTYSETVTITDATVVQTATEPVSESVSEARPPVARFGFDMKNGNNSAPANVVFSNTSENADSFQWEFGDSSGSSNQKNPEHLFKNPGEYKVKLTAIHQASGKKDVLEKTLVVEKPLASPLAGFEAVYSKEIVPVKVEFKNLSANADSYNWNFGDFDSPGNESKAESPTHNYTIPGKYKVTLDAINSESGEVHRSTKEITIRSNFSAFVNESLGNESESVVSLLNLPGNEYMAVMKKRNNKSVVLKLNNEGKITGNKEFDYLLSGVVPVISGNNYMMTGIASPGKLFVMGIDSELQSSEPVLFQEDKKFNTDYFFPELAVSVTDELGVIANTFNDRYPLDVFFQKTDFAGRNIPLTDRTFKYSGLKQVTNFIPTGEGGFALTGYWQENKNSPLCILFAKIDRRGHGEIMYITSETNILGCDIKESYQKGFAILRAKEMPDKERYDISFTLVANNGDPTDCANMLPCSVKKDDILKYKPTMIKINEGYAIASHCFNGIDYDINLYWIDKTGNELIRYEPLVLPGDQFVMDLIQTSDGGYMIAGTQKKNGRNEALVIKTDPWGKLNP
jgi:PKD repeat protein